jgi:hypothetical protein
LYAKLRQSFPKPYWQFEAEWEKNNQAREIYGQKMYYEIYKYFARENVQWVKSREKNPKLFKIIKIVPKYSKFVHMQWVQYTTPLSGFLKSRSKSKIFPTTIPKTLLPFVIDVDENQLRRCL